MAYTAPTTRSTSELITASIWNTDLVDNIVYLEANSVLVSGDTMTGTLTVPSLSVSDVAPSTPVAGRAYKDALVSAWAKVTFSGGTPSIADDYNVSSLTDNGTGDTTVTFATAASNATYAAVATTNTNAYQTRTFAYATGSVKVGTDQVGVGPVDENFSVIVAGGWQ